MIIASRAPASLVILLFVLLALAAAEDGWRLRVSNILVLGIAGTGVAAVIVSHMGWDAWQPVALAAAVLAIGTPMFGAGWVGGGDVKLLAASALWFTFADGWRMLVIVALCGGVVTLLILALRKVPWSGLARSHVIVLQRRGGIPYGIAIAAGVAAAVSLARMPPPRISALPSTSLAVPH